MDELFGGSENDTIYGDGDNDEVYGEGGNDTLYGGSNSVTLASGWDTINGGLDNDIINGEDGNDTLLGDAGDDIMQGGPGDDQMDGGFDNDTMYGDTLGSEGADAMWGGPGNDTMDGGNKDDLMHGGGGDDLMLGGLGWDTMWGDDDDDTMGGNEGRDTMYGGDGDDDMSGGAGEWNIEDPITGNTMFGGYGADSMVGGIDTDLMYGGFGCDYMDGAGNSGGTQKVYGEEGDDEVSGDGLVVGGLGHDKENGVWDTDPSEGCEPGVGITYAGALVVSEWGSTATFEVRLRYMPRFPVQIPITSSNTFEGTVSPSVLTFDSTNWTTPQTVTVTGVDDTLDDGHQSFQIVLGSIVSNDPEYSGMDPDDLPATSLDDDPDAVDDSVSAGEGEVVNIAVTDNDQDIDGTGDFQVLSYTQPIEGTVSGSLFVLTYTPPHSNWNGTVTFEYTLVNEHNRTDVATVSITLLPENDPPTANGFSLTTDEDTPVSFTLMGQDGDPMPTENQALTFQITAGPFFGQITSFDPSTGDGTYLPNPDYNNGGDIYDFFYFTVTDDGSAGGPALTSEAATMLIRVNPVNDKPTAIGRTIQTEEDTPVGFMLEAHDEDPEVSQTLIYQIVAQPSHGTLGFDGTWWTYTPDPDYSDPAGDSFQFKVIDDEFAGDPSYLHSDVATVQINILPVNDPPNAYGTGATVDEDGGLSFQLAGDSGDPQTQTLTFVVNATPLHGDVSIDPVTGYATYVPHPDYHGPDSFEFYVYDDATLGEPLYSDPATATITVAPVNDPPVAEDDLIGFVDLENLSVSAGVVWNDTDIEGDELVVIAVGSAAHGTATFSGGSVTYTLTDMAYVGDDAFSVTISDGNGGTATSTAVVEVHETWGLTAAGQPTAAGDVAPLDPGALRPIIVEARARWEAAGFETSVLDAASFRIMDLEGARLAVAATDLILIDRDAAGFGWFVDATPGDDAEFGRRVASTELWATPDSRAYGRMDLLTVIMHEMGHLLGVDHGAAGSHRVMEETLAAGVRRVPGEADLAALLMEGSNEYASLKRRLARAADHFFADASGVDDLLNVR